MTLCISNTFDSNILKWKKLNINRKMFMELEYYFYFI